MLRSEADANRRLGADPHEPFKDFLRVLEPISSGGTLKQCVTATVKIWFATELLDDKEIPASLDQLAAAEELLKGATKQNESPGHQFPRIWLLLAATKLKAKSVLTEGHLHSSFTLAYAAFESEDYVIYRSILYSALKLAYDLEGQRGDQKMLERIRKTTNEAHFHQLTFEDSVAQSAMQLHYAIARYAFWKHTTDGAYSTETFDLEKAFWERFPDFDAPFPRFNGIWSLVRGAGVLGMKTIASKYAADLELLRQQCPPRNVDEQEMSDIDFELIWEVDVSQAHAKESGDLQSEKFMAIAATLLIQWIELDLEMGSMSVSDAKTLLRWNEMQTNYPLMSGSVDDVHEGSAENNSDSDDMEKAKLLRMIKDGQFPSIASRCWKGYPKPRRHEDWGPWIEFVETWLTKERKKPSIYQRLLTLGKIQHARCLNVSAYRRRFPGEVEWIGVIYWREYQRELDLCKRLQALDVRLVPNHSMDAVRFSAASTVTTLAEVKELPDGLTAADEDLVKAMNDMKDLLGDVLARGRLEFAQSIHCCLAEMQWNRYAKFSTVEPWDALPHWEAAYELETTIRLDQVNLDATESFQAKEHLATLMPIALARQEAMMACVRSSQVYLLSSPEKKAVYDQDQRLPKIMSDMTLWAQRCKARALTEILGKKLKTPMYVEQNIGQNPELKLVWDQMNSLVSKIATSDIVEKMALREQLKILTETCRAKDTITRAFLDLRDGRPLNVRDFIKLGKDLGPGTVVVEWVEVFPIFPAWDILILIYRNGNLIKMSPVLGKKLSEVKQWVDEFLGVEDDIGPERPLSHNLAKQDLNQLRPVVEQIKDCTQPGDTLVFCPIDQMHRIPLHAITLEGQVLIERNPVVYIQSLALLRFCRSTFEPEASDRNSPFQASVFNTLVEDSSSSLSALASTIPGCELVDADNFTDDRKGYFRTKCSVSNLVHIHGHAEFENDPSVVQCLKLKEPSRGPVDDMGLDEIFSTLRFRQPSVILAMGCRTGRSKISTLNDLLGLTAAFHFAGAGAVISALWKIWRVDALNFAQIFYDEFARNLDNDGHKTSDGQERPQTVAQVVDLAKAYQKAVLALRKDENGKIRKPYHWAGFTLHGSWLFPNLQT